MKRDWDLLEDQLAKARASLANGNNLSFEARGYALLEIEDLEEQIRVRRIEYAVEQLQLKLAQRTELSVSVNNVEFLPPEPNSALVPREVRSVRRLVVNMVDRRMSAWLRRLERCDSARADPAFEG
jgi:hypothetical protein